LVLLLTEKQYANLLVHVVSIQTQVIHALIPGETTVANIEN